MLNHVRPRSRAIVLAAASIAFSAVSATGAAASTQPSTTREEKALQTSAGDLPADLGPRKPAKPAPPKTFPRGPDGRPDLTGIWYAGIKDFVTLDDRGIEIPLTPEFAAVRTERAKAMDAGKPLPDFVSTCQAFGAVRQMSYGTLEFIHQPKQLTVISEVLHEVRRVYLDGKPHGEFLDYSFGGVSTGHWEGDTLVIETTKLRASFFGMTGAPYSDRMQLVERIRMINRDALENEMTMTDPVALTKPWKVVQRYERQPSDFEVGEYVCMENNHVLDGYFDPKKWLPKSAFSATE